MLDNDNTTGNKPPAPSSVPAQLMLGHMWQFNTIPEERKHSTSLEYNICAEYQITMDDLSKYEVLIGAYWSGCYSGSSWLLLRDRATNELYEVNGGHCSCSGLEGQFVPTRTTLAYLKSDMFPVNRATMPQCEYRGGFEDATPEDLETIRAYINSMT